jgi:D-alanyl-D-alanine carboxypeptidase (penicillin-binding protein 5/6)
VLLGAVLALLLAAMAFAAPRHPLSDKGQMLDEKGRTYPSPVRWPLRGQAALVLGNGRPAASPHEQPVAIASLAKVMTAYLTFERYPLSGAQDGFTITVTEEQAQVEAQGQSVVALESVAPAIGVPTIPAPGAGGPGGDAGRHRPPLLLAPGRPSAQN